MVDHETPPSPPPLPLAPREVHQSLSVYSGALTAVCQPASRALGLCGQALPGSWLTELGGRDGLPPS